MTSWFVLSESEQKATIFGGRVKGGFVVVHDWYQLSCSFKRMIMRLNVIIFEKDNVANSSLLDKRMLSSWGRHVDIVVPDSIGQDL